MPQVHCPSPADLERLFLGTGPEEEILALEQHLLQCRSCLQTLKTLLGTRETLAGLLLGQPRADPFRDSPVVAELLQTLQSLRISAGEARSAPAVVESQVSPAPLSQSAPTQDCKAPASGRDSRLTDFLSPPQANDELGRLGKYRILKVLGHGGMGVVYQAEDPLLKRIVAIKAMLPGLAASASGGQRFLREAQAMAAVKHDRIVTIYQVDEERSVPFLAMEFLEGEPLDEYLKRDRPLPLSEVLRIGREIAEGLAAAHARGLIHRDIKPGNIWLEGERRRVKVLDFGLARATAQEAGLTQPGAILGTPAYMAPEQARGDPVEARSDLFSLGVILYRLCSGRQPFQGKDAVAVLMEVVTHTPPPLGQTNPALPSELSALVMRLLEKDPDCRPASAAKVVEALQALEKDLGREKESGEETVTQSLAQPREAVPQRRRRLPVLIAALALLAGLLGMGTLAVIHITTGQGDYVIETDDPDFTFQVRKGTVILRDGKTGRTYRMKVHNQDKATGAHELEVTDGDADLAFQTRTFTIRRGQQVALKAWFERKPASEKNPTTDAAWLKKVAGLPPDKQVAAVAAKLKEHNPGFDGAVTPTVEAGVVTELQFLAHQVTDLTPVRALPGLRKLNCRGTEAKKGQLAGLSPLKDMKLMVLDCSYTNVFDLSPLKDMKLTGLDCYFTNVSDLSPLKNMRLEELNCWCTKVADLSPLKNMRLTFLCCRGTPVADLTPVKGMKLRSLDIAATGVSDLSPLEGMQLNDLECGGTPVSNLSPLKEMKLMELECDNTQVSDLSPLKGMPLSTLNLDNTQVSDLSPLKDMKLTELHCKGTQVSDLSPLKGLPLKVLWCDFKPERDATILRSIKTLESINGKPAQAFWKELDAKKP